MPTIYLTNVKNYTYKFDSNQYFIFPITGNDSTPTQGIFGLTTSESEDNGIDDINQWIYVFGLIFT